MRSFSLLFLVSFGLACSDSGAPAVTANTLVRVSGDSQATLTGNPLTAPLKVRVTGTDGHPYVAATITWSVIGGSATLGSPTSLSDSTGDATMTVTLGATPGAISIQAAVASVTPVTFGATACDHPLLALNDTLPGALATTDCKFGGFYTDFYDLTVPAPGGVEFTMRSAIFDTWLEMYLRAGTFIGYDDDIDSSNTNSQLTAILPAGDYLLAPSSYNNLTTGAYTMAALTKPASLSACGVVWVTRGVSINDSVTTSDCVDSTTGKHYADVVALYLVAGTNLKVNHRSTDFDAALFLHNSAGIGVASNNDSANAGTTTNAYISFPVVTTGSYLLFVATNDTVATGTYTLSIDASTTAVGSGPREQGEGRQLLPVGGQRWPKRATARFWSRR